MLPTIRLSLALSLGLLIQVATAAPADPVTPFSTAWITKLLNSKCKVLDAEENAGLSENVTYIQSVYIEAYGGSQHLIEQLKFAFYSASQPIFSSCAEQAKQTIIGGATVTRVNADEIRASMKINKEKTLERIKNGEALSSSAAQPGTPESSAAK